MIKRTAVCDGCGKERTWDDRTMISLGHKDPLTGWVTFQVYGALQIRETPMFCNFGCMIEHRDVVDRYLVELAKKGDPCDCFLPGMVS